MDSKLVSKASMGGVATIIFVILLSHTRFFTFLINTVLGRAMLLLLVLGISCVHHIFGVIAVLAIIVIYNHSGMEYMEGYEAMSATTDENTKKPMAQASSMVPVTPATPATSMRPATSMTPATTTMAPATTTMAPAMAPAMTPAMTPMTDTKTKMETGAASKTTDPIGAREGFNMRDYERTMQKGKRSSDIMGIANIRRQSDDAVEPNDPSGFTDNAAPF